MALDTLSNTLRSHVKAKFEAIDAVTPIVWENLTTDSKGNSKRSPDPANPSTSKWIQVFIDLNISQWVAPEWVDRAGSVTISCYATKNSGPGHVEALARVAEQIFRKPNHTFGTGVVGVFQPPDVTQVGETEDGWFRYNVRAEFWAQEAA